MKLTDKILIRLCGIWLWDKKRRKEFRKAHGVVMDDYDIHYSHYGERFIYYDKDGNDLVYKELSKEEPCFITRFGRCELETIAYFYNNRHLPNVIFPDSYKDFMKNNAGFFSSDDYNLTRFSMETLDFVKNIDVLGTWHYYNENEKNIFEKYNQIGKCVGINSIGVWNIYYEKPWTRFLKGKKVLVIHPFEKTIKKQYEKREKLFKDPQVLPEFDLKIIKAVQGIGNASEIEKYESWFDALEDMYRKIDETDFDIALIAAGAYGMFLANYIKSKGKQAVHIGGSLQLLFGIKGSRWLNREPVKSLINEHWIFPLEEDTPKNLNNFIKNENSSAYW